MVDVAIEIELVEERDPARPYGLLAADIAECACPDFCERDHDNE